MYIIFCIKSIKVLKWWPMVALMLSLYQTSYWNLRSVCMSMYNLTNKYQSPTGDLYCRCIGVGSFMYFFRGSNVKIFTSPFWSTFHVRSRGMILLYIRYLCAFSLIYSSILANSQFINQPNLFFNSHCLCKLQKNACR